MSESEFILKVEDIHKSFGSSEVLKGVSFNVKKGETICFLHREIFIVLNRSDENVV